MSMTARAGFGLDYNYRDLYPGTLLGMCDRYRDRLSHLSIVALRTPSEARKFVEVARGLPVIHHLSNVAPANPGGPDLERLAHQDAISRELQATWCGEDLGIWSIGPYSIPYFVPPLLDEDVANVVAARIAEVARRSSVPFLAEVPSCSFVAGGLTLGAFFHRIVAASGCSIVLDVSHVVSYALASGVEPAVVLESLPLDAAWEIHVAGGRLNSKHPDRYVDTHNHPILEPVLDVLRAALSSCPNVRAVTFELGDAVTDALIEEGLDAIEQIAAAAAFTPRLAASTHGAGAVAD